MLLQFVLIVYWFCSKPFSVMINCNYMASSGDVVIALFAVCSTNHLWLLFILRYGRIFKLIKYLFSWFFLVVWICTCMLWVIWFFYINIGTKWVHKGGSFRELKFKRVSFDNILKNSIVYKQKKKSEIHTLNENFSKLRPFFFDLFLRFFIYFLSLFPSSYWR